VNHVPMVNALFQEHINGDDDEEEGKYFSEPKWVSLKRDISPNPCHQDRPHGERRTVLEIHKPNALSRQTGTT
jgi:hypothetical protein